MIPLLLSLCAVAGAAELLWSADLEGDDGGLTVYGETMQWEWGEIASGPGASYDGSACWATRVGGWYLNDSTDYLELSGLPVDGAARPVLALQHWYEVLKGDSCSVELLDGGVWTPVEPIYGYPEPDGFIGHGASWRQAWFDLSQATSGDVRFVISTDGAGADDGWYLDDLELWDGDVVPPQVSFDGCLPDTEDLEGPFVVEATVSDDLALSSVLLVYSIDGGAERRRAMSGEGAPVYWATIPGQPLGSLVRYHIEARDEENLSRVPEEPCSFEVRLPAPRDPSGPDGVVWGDTAPLSWRAPLSSHELVAYRLYRDDRLLLETEDTQVDAPVLTGEQEFTVSGLYSEGEGARSEPLSVRAAVPAVESLQPTGGYQGDHLRLELTGEYLLLEQGDLQMDLGDGVRIIDHDVRDVDYAFVTVFVAETAPVGMRDLLLTTGGHEVLAEQAFEVLAGSERPRLTGIEPGTVRQGDELDLLVSASHAFADLPSVWLGDHIVVSSTELLEDDLLSVSAVVPYTTPLGMQNLEVDDGVRIFDGLQLQVRDYIAPVDPGGDCSHTRGGRGPWLMLLGLVATLLRRRR